MPKLNHTLTGSPYFEIDGELRGKGNYEIDYTTPNCIGVYSILDSNRRYYIVAADTNYSDWTNNDDTPYASYQALLDDLKACFFAYEDYGVNLSNAIDRIYQDYGDRVRIKPKALLKFGKNGDVGTSFEPVWDQGGFETLPSDNVINRISSSDELDNQPVIIEGHTIDQGTGDLTFVVQSATLDGQNEVSLTTPLYRSNRIYNNTTTGDGNGAGDFNGDIYVYESGGTVTAGVPQDATKIHSKANSDGNQSDKCATSISSVDYYLITTWSGGVRISGGTPRIAEFLLQMRSQTGVWRTIDRLVSSNNSGTFEQTLNPVVIIPKNHDVRVVAKSSGTGTEVDANFNGYLANIIA